MTPSSRVPRPLPPAPPEPGFPTRITVRFRDLDPMGHVNNAVYFTYLEVARMEYWFGLERHPSPVAEGHEAVRFTSFVVARAECSYRSPAVFGETLVVRTGIRDLGVTSFRMDYTVREEATGRLVAEASTTLVFYDAIRKRAARIPEDWRARILSFEECQQQAAGR